MGETNVWRRLGRELTLVLLRRVLVPSIQMYSAKHLPLWSSFMYFASCRGDGQFACQVLEVFDGLLTLPEFDTVVESPLWTPDYCSSSVLLRGPVVVPFLP